MVVRMAVGSGVRVCRTLDFWKFYQNDDTEFYNPTDLSSDNPDLSPLAEASFEGLPPAFVQVFGYDLMRDDGLLYAERLREAKVPLKLVV